MRQVNRDELIHIFYSASRGWTSALRRMLASPQQEVRERARMLIAEMLADKLERLEILSDAPPPPPFRFANHHGGSGVPSMDEERGTVSIRKIDLSRMKSGPL